DAQDCEIKYAIFIEFYYEELFVDINNTDLDKLIEILNKQIISGELTFPWVYGRLLYDKYFEEFNEQDDELEYENTIKLLKDTPTGVFQLGNLIVGPLGVIKGANKRLIPPTLHIKLWHCSDPSCTAFHDTELNSAITIIDVIHKEMYSLFKDEQESEWGEFYGELIDPQSRYYDINRLFDIPYLLINAFGYRELKRLLQEVIENDSEFRNRLPSSKKVKGSANDIVSKLTKYECFQILLLAKDEVIVKLVEKLISSNDIVIPPTEIRKELINRHVGAFEIYHECNKLGIRAVSHRYNLALARLNNLIMEIYNDPILKENLEWRFRGEPQKTFKEKIESYTLKEEPRKIISEVILSGPVQIKKTFSVLFGDFKMPDEVEEVNVTIDKILWKLGFDINLYPSFLTKFWERSTLFQSVVKGCTNLNDTEKDKIRSSAVNFFVSVEEIIEQALSFITWALLSDHYIETKFRYNFETARDFMCVTLNGHVISGNSPLIFDQDGKNTLFPLTAGFSALIEICDKMISEGAAKYKRPASELPHLYKKMILFLFH
ncbi:MAG TPA: hypothetical protein VN922_23620, partial [Bacteroidia bacterium]|nr:hypothetical protein [Bacteroidia bacterium]